MDWSLKVIAWFLTAEQPRKAKQMLLALNCAFSWTTGPTSMLRTSLVICPSRQFSTVTVTW